MEFLRTFLGKDKPTRASLTQQNMAPEEFIDQPVWRNFDSRHLILGGGVAIFHIASSRVVVIRHSRKNYWFLPKGRRDVGEESAAGAEREGFEEVSSSSKIHRVSF